MSPSVRLCVAVNRSHINVSFRWAPREYASVGSALAVERKEEVPEWIELSTASANRLSNSVTARQSGIAVVATIIRTIIRGHGGDQEVI